MEESLLVIRNTCGVTSRQLYTVINEALSKYRCVYVSFTCSRLFVVSSVQVSCNACVCLCVRLRPLSLCMGSVDSVGAEAAVVRSFTLVKQLAWRRPTAWASLPRR